MEIDRRELSEAKLTVLIDQLETWSNDYRSDLYEYDATKLQEILDDLNRFRMDLWR